MKLCLQILILMGFATVAQAHSTIYFNELPIDSSHILENGNNEQVGCGGECELKETLNSGYGSNEDLAKEIARNNAEGVCGSKVKQISDWSMDRLPSIWRCQVRYPFSHCGWIATATFVCQPK